MNKASGFHDVYKYICIHTANNDCFNGDFRTVSATTVSISSSAMLTVGVKVNHTLDITQVCEDRNIESPEFFVIDFTVATPNSINVSHIPLITEASFIVQDTTGLILMVHM